MTRADKPAALLSTQAEVYRRPALLGKDLLPGTF
jgi:hypothetical protein